MVCFKEQNLSFCTFCGVWGDDFHKKFIKKFQIPTALKGSRNIQGFVLIRAVLFKYKFTSIVCYCIFVLKKITFSS